MPHAVYLHSGLTQARIPARDEREKHKILRISNTEVIVALAVAGLVNMAMVMMASSAFHAGHSDVAQIETAYHTLTPLLGIAAAGIFLMSLLASEGVMVPGQQWNLNNSSGSGSTLRRIELAHPCRRTLIRRRTGTG